MPKMIYLREKAPRGEIRGHVVGMTLPLQPKIRSRWDEGDLVRVTEDGEPWPGGDFLPDDVPDSDPVPKDAAVMPESFTDGDAEPERPAGNAHRDRWADYAVALGAVSGEDAAEMKRDDLVALVTPAG
jgi:hypothetical protein